MRDSSANSSLRWEPCEQKLTIHLCTFKQGMVAIVAYGGAVVIYFHLLCFGLFLPCLFFALFLQVVCSSVMQTQNVLCQYRSYEVNTIKEHCTDAKRKLDTSSIYQNKSPSVSLNDNQNANNHKTGDLINNS